jgi:hypothetical protein
MCIGARAGRDTQRTEKKLSIIKSPNPICPIINKLGITNIFSNFVDN